MNGSASMGHDLPASIGAYYGALALKGNAQRIICLAGDGSIMMNIQELQTIASLSIPVKVFVLDNGGYLSIRSSQTNFFKRCAGESAKNGVNLPDFTQLAAGFGLKAIQIASHTCAQTIADFIAAPGPGLAHVILDSTQGFEPRMSSKQQADGSIVSPSLEDMYPFLSQQEMEQNIYYANNQEDKIKYHQQEVMV
jgi:acetolactate synthase I/II/III large subunit